MTPDHLATHAFEMKSVRDHVEWYWNRWWAMRQLLTPTPGRE